MIRFLNITIQCKGLDDWRSFLDWADRDTMLCYQLRGYGSTPGQAADDAWRRYNEDKEFYAGDSWDWVDEDLEKEKRANDKVALDMKNPEYVQAMDKLYEQKWAHRFD